MSGGGFLRGPAPATSSSASGFGSSRADEPTPQQRDDDQARAELLDARQLVTAAHKLDQVPAAAWTEKRDQLAAKVDAFAVQLRAPAGVTPSESADRDRAATVAAIQEARETIARARRPRVVPPVAGEEDLEPRLTDKSITPDEVIDWMAGLSASQRAAVWRRYLAASGNRADAFAVAFANYVASHRDRTPPLSTDLQALATMDARRFAEWRELSGRGALFGQTDATPPTAAQSRPLELGGRSFVDAAIDQDHDGHADTFSGQREPAPPPPEQTQADVAATRAGVAQATTALADVTAQVLPAYDDAIAALSAAGAYQLQARAIFVFRQAVAFRAQLRTMGATEALAQLEHAIDAAGGALTRRLTGRELHGRPVLPDVAAIDLAATKDPAALLQHDAEIAIQVIEAAQQVAARLSPDEPDHASAPAAADPAAAQEAAALVHRFRTRPLSYAFLRALLVERGLWSQLESAPLHFPNGLPMLRTLADDVHAADAQAAEFGADADLGAFNLPRAEELLRANGDDSPEHAFDGQQTPRAREIRDMLANLEPIALGRTLTALERRGMLGDFIDPLAPNEVAALHARLPTRGLGEVKAELRRRFEGRDTADRSLSHYFGKVPALGGVLKFAGNVATGGFLAEHDAQYGAMKHGDITEGEYNAATNHAAVRSLATVAVSGYVGGAGGAYAEGLTAGVAARSTVGRYASRAFVGAAEGFAGGLGAQAGADLVDQHFSGFGAYGEAGAMGAGIGAGISVVAGVGAEGAKFLPPGVQTIAQKIAAKFPHHADIFDGIRATGAEHGAVIRIKVGRLLQLADDFQLPGVRPMLAFAADGGPPLALDEDVITTFKATRPLDAPGDLDGPAPITVLEARRLPERQVSRADDLASTGDEIDPLTNHLGDGPEASSMQVVDAADDATRQRAATAAATRSNIGSRTPLAEHIPPPGPEFVEWWDSLNAQELDRFLRDKSKGGLVGAKDVIDANIRHPGGLHEWLMVKHQQQIKKWNVSLQTVLDARTRTEATIGRGFKHGGDGSTRMHNDLSAMIAEAPTFDAFKVRLNAWADRELFPIRGPNGEPPAGRYYLPADLQLPTR